MSTTDPPAGMSNSEELVAYLDGELRSEDCRRIEQRLSADAAYRRELAELDQAWSALEELPHAVATEDFARTTIEMVAVATERESSKRTASGSTRLWRGMLLVAALGGILAVAGYAAVDRLLPNPDDALIADLPIIAEFDALNEIRDVEFLRELGRLGTGQFVADENGYGTASEPAYAADGAATRADRMAWINRLSANERAELAGKFSRFNDPSFDTQRDQLRRLYAEIAAADDRDELRATIVAYGTWIKNRTPGERITLRELPPNERIRKVEELVEQSDRSARRRLSPTDEKALQEAILDFVGRRRQELIREIRRQGNPELQRLAEGRSTAMVALFIIRREMRGDRGRERLQDLLVSQLSPQTQEYLESLPRRERGRRLMWWCREALDPRFGPRELEKYFVEDLEADQRAELLALPQSEMEERLEQLYVGSQVGLRGREWLDDDRPPGFDPDDGPGPRDRGRRERDRPERFFDDGPPPGPPGRRRPPPREFDDRRPGRGRFDGPPPPGPPRDRRPEDRREERPPEPI
jgi:hypothetical protein